MKTFIKRSVFAAMLGLAAVPQAQATTFPAGSCSTSGPCLTFGDFNVYSLAFLNVTAGFGAPTSGDPYYVRSQPGDIDSGVVFGTGAQGNPVNQNFSGMDDASHVAGAQGGGETSFSTTIVADPGTSTGSSPASDLITTWDSDISAMRSFLATGGGDFTPFFNLNETGTDGLRGIDLQIWVHMWVDNGLASTDPTYQKQDFYLFGSPLEFGGPGATRSATGPSMTSINDADPQWAYVHGTICVNGSTVEHLGPCTSSDPATSKNVDQNLGANNAAFAIYNAELDNIIKTSSIYTAFHLDWRMIHEDNGYEQAFLLNNTTIPGRTVPEPTALALLAIGLLGMGISRKFAAM